MSTALVAGVLLVLVLFIALKALVWRVQQRLEGPVTPCIPRVRTGLPLLGPAVAFGSDPVGTLQWAQRKYGDCFELNLLLFNATFIMDPANYKHYFNAKESDLNFDKGVEKFMQPIFGIGDMSSQPKDALDACHKVLRQGLGRRYLPSYAENAVDVARDYFEKWSAEGDSRNLMAVINDLVASINVRNFAGEHVQQRHAQTVAVEMNSLEHNGTSPLALMLPWAPLPAIRRCASGNRNAEEARKIVSCIIEDEFARRKAAMAGGRACPDDFFQQFIETRLDDGREISTSLMLQTMIAVFFGAHHNTTNTTTWLLATLVTHPDVLASCMDEQRALIDKSGADVTFEQILEMTYLKQCMEEISRLYFTVMVPPRKVETPFRLQRTERGGSVSTTDVVVPEGAYVCISPITNHYNPDIFPDPTRFDPTRFSAARGKNPYGMSYVQFGYGRHRCTGELYAMHVIRAITSVLLREFDMTIHAAADNKEVMHTLPLPRFEKTIGTAVSSAPIYASIAAK